MKALPGLIALAPLVVLSAPVAASSCYSVRDPARRQAGLAEERGDPTLASPSGTRTIGRSAGRGARQSQPQRR
jgi:hypothetical protein